VDDVPTNLDVAEGLLSPYELKVSRASSGREALELVSAIRDDDPPEKKYDIILMDHMMPGMDGIETTRKIRDLPSEYSRSVPVVAFTANAVPGNDTIFLKSGFNGFIAKPIDVAQLDAALNRFVRNSEKDAAYKSSMRRGLSPVSDNGEVAPPPVVGFSETVIKGLDIPTGISRYGKEDKYLKVLKSYILHTPKLLGTLRETATTSLADYAIAVHGLKGSSYGISATEVGDLAAKLEKMSKAGETQGFEEAHNNLLELTEELISGISQVVERLEAQDLKKVVKEKLPQPDTDLLERLLEYSKRGKTSLMEEALSELERYEYEEDMDLLRFLRDNLENFDYPAMCERLEKKLKRS
jgi:CheY-like chemotaxis protein